MIIYLIAKTITTTVTGTQTVTPLTTHASLLPQSLSQLQLFIAPPTLPLLLATDFFTSGISSLPQKQPHRSQSHLLSDSLLHAFRHNPINNNSRERWSEERNTLNHQPPSHLLLLLSLVEEVLRDNLRAGRMGSGRKGKKEKEKKERGGE